MLSNRDIFVDAAGEIRKPWSQHHLIPPRVESIIEGNQLILPVLQWDKHVVVVVKIRIRYNARCRNRIDWLYCRHIVGWDSAYACGRIDAVGWYVSIEIQITWKASSLTAV